MAFELYERVKVIRNGVIGQIIDIAKLDDSTVYTVESETPGKRDDADYPTDWPLYNCKSDEIVRL